MSSMQLSKVGQDDVDDGDQESEEKIGKDGHEGGNQKSEVSLTELDRKLVEMVMYFNVSVVDASERLVFAIREKFAVDRDFFYSQVLPRVE